MPENNKDPLEFLSKLSESYRQIRFGRGVVGKTGHATLAILAVWAIVLFRLSENIWLDIGLLSSGGIATILYWWWVRGTQTFAKENPGLALMEGAELLEYQKFEAQVKGLPPGQQLPVILEPPSPQKIEGNR